MKKINAIIGKVFLLLIISGVLLAFAKKIEDKKKLVTTTYYFVCGTPNQFIPPGVPWHPDPRKRSLSSPIFQNTGNWTTVAPAPGCSSGDYICSITFDEEFIADGDADGQLTLGETLKAVWGSYISVMPHDLAPTIIVGACTITVARRSTPC